MTESASLLEQLISTLRKKKNLRPWYKWLKKSRKLYSDEKKQNYINSKIESCLLALAKNYKIVATKKGQRTSHYYDGEELEGINEHPLTSEFYQDIGWKYDRLGDWKILGCPKDGHEEFEKCLLKFCEKLNLKQEPCGCHRTLRCSR